VGTGLYLAAPVALGSHIIIAAMEGDPHHAWAANITPDPDRGYIFNRGSTVLPGNFPWGFRVEPDS
jgi:hypothetical protein